MKILNLQSKANLAGWSVFLSLLVNIAILKFAAFQPCKDCILFTGLPFKFELPVQGSIDFDSSMPVKLLGNFVFWLLLIFVILNLVGYIRNKNRLAQVQ